MMGTHLLDYVLAPTPFPLQASSTAVLTLLVTNNSSTPVTLKGISIKIPAGPDGAELMIDHDKIAQIAPNSQWKHDESKLEPGFVTFIFVPIDKTYILLARDALTFGLVNIKVNDQPGNVKITVTEGSSGNPKQDLIISKFPAGWGTISFTAFPANIHAGENVTLSWSGPAGATYSIQYIDEHEQIITIPADGQPPLGNSGVYPGAGQPSLVLAHTTAFTLTVAYTDPNTKNIYHSEQQQTVTVALAAPEIIRFTAELDFSASEPVLLLDWKTANADHVEGSWTSELLVANPQVKTPIHAPFEATYMITAIGTNGRQSNPKARQLGWGVSSHINVGNFPIAIAFSSDSKCAFAINIKEGTASVIDVSALQVTKTISVGYGPEKVVFSPDGMYAFVVNDNAPYVSAVVSVIDTHTLQVIKTIPIGDYPGGIAILPDGKYVFVANGENAVSVIAVDNLQVTKTITAGRRPGPITVSPDGKYAFVANVDAVAIIIIETMEVVDRIAVSNNGNYMAIAFSPDGKYVFVTDSNNNMVLVIDVNAKKIVHTTPVGPGARGIAFSPNGRYAFIVNQFGPTVSVIDVSSLQVMQTITVGPYASSIACSPNGRYVFVGNQDNTLSVLRMQVEQ